MTTQAIQNSANILAVPMPVSGNAPASSEAPEIPFNQVLQREVTERRSEPASKPDARQSEAASAQAAAPARKSDSEAVEEKRDAAASDESVQSDEADGPSAELLALVASMTQFASANAQTDAKDGDASSGMPVQIDALTGKGKRSAAGVDKPQDAENPAMKETPADSVQELAASAKNGKNEPDIERMQPALVSTASQTGNSTTLPAAAVPADHMAANLDAPLSVQSLLPVQHGLNKVHAAATQGMETLTPPVGTPAWDQAVGQKVVWMVAGAQQSASLTLNPPDLGPMQIVLNVSNAQANATFTAAQPEVRQALEAALPRLREMLGDAGIQLGQTNINAGTPQHGGQFEQNGKPSSSSHPTHGQPGDQPVAATRQPVIRRGLGMVDTFA